MFSMFRTVVLSTMIGLGGLAALPGAAQADGIYLAYGDGPRFGVQVGPDGHSNRRDDWRRDQRRDDWRRGEWRDGWRMQGCTPRRALEKAERMGIRRADIRYVGQRAIGVSGRVRGNPVFITFTRAPFCPVIS